MAGRKALILPAWLVSVALAHGLHSALDGISLDFSHQKESDIVLQSALPTCSNESREHVTAAGVPGGEVVSGSHSNTNLWEVRISPGKGRGIFAMQDIGYGTKILDELPLFTVTPPPLVPGRGYAIEEMVTDVQTKFDELSGEQQEEFLSCHDERSESDQSLHKLLTILRSNAYTTQDGRVAMYPKVALINHSCQPNVFNVDNHGTRVIIATRDIAKGEEILTTYIPLLMNTESRNRRLRQYGFQCQCAACSSGVSDVKRQRSGRHLAELQEALTRKQSRQAAHKLASQAEKLAEYVEEEGFADYFIKTSRLALQYADRAGDKLKARQWASKHLSHHIMVDKDSNESHDAEVLLKSI